MIKKMEEDSTNRHGRIDTAVQHESLGRTETLRPDRTHRPNILEEDQCFCLLYSRQYYSQGGIRPCGSLCSDICRCYTRSSHYNQNCIEGCRWLGHCEQGRRCLYLYL